MLGRGVGLINLIERAGKEACPYPLSWERQVADEVCRYAEAGLFDMACRLVSPWPGYFSDSLSDELEYLTEDDDWINFAETVYFADLIDNFLANLERDHRTASVARGCRDDLDGLLILADLCEESDLPRAAEEARYLHRQTVSLLRGPWPMRTPHIKPLVPPRTEGDME